MLCEDDLCAGRRFAGADGHGEARCALRTDGTGGFVFVNHYQRRTRLKDVEQAVFEVESRNVNGTCETIRFPALDICGEVSFFLPYKMDLAGAELTWATAQPLCREGNTFFFLEIPGMEPVYCPIAKFGS